MNVERFYAAILEFQSAKNNPNIAALLNNVLSTLSQSLAQPAQPQLSENFKNQYSQLIKALTDQDMSSLSITTRKIYEELNINDSIGHGLRDIIENIFNQNQYTPANTQTQLQALIQQVTQVYQHVDTLVASLAFLKVPLHKLDAGTAEVGVSIPKNIFEGELDELEKEFHKIDKAFRPFKEISSDDTSSMKVRAISASEWQVFLDMLPVSAMAVSIAIERIVHLYKSNLEIKLLKQQLEEKNLPGNLTQEIQDYIESEITKGLADIASEIVDEFHTKDEHRHNELKKAINASLTYLAKRMDHGATVDVTMEPPKVNADGGEEGKSSTANKQLLKISNTIKEKMKGVVQMQALDQPPLGINFEHPTPTEDETKNEDDI